MNIKKMLLSKIHLLCRGRHYYAINDNLAYSKISKLINSQIYIPWTSYALRPFSVECILNEIIINNKQKIIEFGCGISSLYISSLISNITGAHLTLIDHNKSWLEVVQRYLNVLNIPSCSYSIVYAPLTNQSIDRRNFYYYDSQAMRETFGKNLYDMVIVDGPPGSSSKLARYPALHLLKSNLANEFVVFLDDVCRRDEAKITKLWSQEFNLSVHHPTHSDSLAVLRSKTARSLFISN